MQVETHFKRQIVRLTNTKLTQLFYKIYIRDDMQCQNPYCNDGLPIDIPHHVLFKSQGGEDIEENLTLICTHCHRKVHHTAELKITGEYPNFEYEDIKK